MGNKISEQNHTEVKGNFSVGLGLLDYVNPIFYAVTSITILVNLFGLMKLPMYVLYALGALVSLIFGFTIPTVKVLVGLGKMEFALPVNLVSYVNLGIFLSGLMLLGYAYKIAIPVFLIIIALVVAFLFLVYKKTGNFNAVAVLIGAAGYLLIYASLLKLAVAAAIPCIILYAVAICLFVALVTMGVKGDVMNAKLHWVIESTNITCQACVAIATLLLFLVF